MIAGALTAAAGEIEINPGRRTTRPELANTGARPG